MALIKVALLFNLALEYFMKATVLLYIRNGLSR